MLCYIFSSVPRELRISELIEISIEPNIYIYINTSRLIYTKSFYTIRSNFSAIAQGYNKFMYIILFFFIPFHESYYFRLSSLFIDSFKYKYVYSECSELLMQIIRF